MYFLVTKIENDGTRNPSFTLDIQGLGLLLEMVTLYDTFEIKRIS